MVCSIGAIRGIPLLFNQFPFTFDCLRLAVQLSLDLFDLGDLCFNLFLLLFIDGRLGGHVVLMCCLGSLQLFLLFVQFHLK